jgi:hypothetical protein
VKPCLCCSSTPFPYNPAAKEVIIKIYVAIIVFNAIQFRLSKATLRGFNQDFIESNIYRVSITKEDLV